MAHMGKKAAEWLAKIYFAHRYFIFTVTNNCCKEILIFYDKLRMLTFCENFCKNVRLKHCKKPVITHLHAEKNVKHQYDFSTDTSVKWKKNTNLWKGVVVDKSWVSSFWVFAFI